MTELKYESNVTCPHCGHINTLKIPKEQGLMWTTCQGCNEAIWGHSNPHGGDGIFCTYGDVPGINEQEKNL